MLKPNIIQVHFYCISEKNAHWNHSSKNWWTLVTSLLGDSNNRSIPPIQTDDDIIHDDAKKSEMFNDFFCDQWNQTMITSFLPILMAPYTKTLDR